MRIHKLLNILLINLLIVCYSIAQESESISVTAAILSPISFSNKRDLNFGSEVLPGKTYNILPSDASKSGRFTLSGAGGKEVNLIFNLPDELMNSDESMSITFGASSAMHIKEVSGSFVIGYFNPVTGTNTTLSNAGELIISIGGQISPSSGQAPGEYSAEIQLVVSYTGN